MNIRLKMQRKNPLIFQTNCIISCWKQKLNRWEFDAVAYSEFRILQFLRIKILGDSKLCNSIWHFDCHLLFAFLLHHSKETRTLQLHIGENCSPISSACCEGKCPASSHLISCLPVWILHCPQWISKQPWNVVVLESHYLIFTTDFLPFKI